MQKTRQPEAPALSQWQQARKGFRWDSVMAELDGLPGGGLNIAHEAVDRHASGALADHVALRWLGRDRTVLEFSYCALSEASNRFANVLAGLGVQPGERVFSLAGRLPELYFAALGSLKHRAVFCPLFAAFGPEPIVQRLQRGGGRVLVTTMRLYRRKVAALRAQLPELKTVLLIDAEQDASADILALRPLLAQASQSYTIGPTDPEDPALLHFTSGTTGMPKGAVHVHQAVLMHRATGSWVLGLQPGDVYWCTADPGWVTGTSYGIIAPFVHGVTNVVDEAEFDAERWYQILAEQRVQVWYTAPTAIRMLMRCGIHPLERFDLSQLRLVLSVGEPLNPEAILWAREALGQPILDTWWQTETGGIAISNLPQLPLRPGSMGQPLPGIEAAILRREEDGSVQELATGEEGELALRRGWPSQFRAYLHEPERTARCFSGDWYLTGDQARIDADGYVWFVGRADDIIKTAGHMVGPFEVESALMEHPAVAEAAVVGLPDPLIGQLVKAYCVLARGHDPDHRLERAILGFARKRLGSAVAPKRLEFVKGLPKTRSGKILRRLLKARELGLPEGDTSTLEEEAS